VRLGGIACVTRSVLTAWRSTRVSAMTNRVALTWSTRLQHPERLERLLLAVALATLWCHELGEQVMSQAESIRRLIFQSPRPTCYSFSLANLSNSSTSNIGVIQFVLGNTNRCPNIQHRTAITCALRNCLTKQKRPTAPVDQKDSRFA